MSDLPRARPSSLGAWLLAGTLLVASAWSFPYFARLGSPNELTRLYLARAVVDDGALSIDGPVARHGRLTDMASHDGRLYSDKAPGIGLLGAPVYALVKACAGWDTAAVSNELLLRLLRLLLAGVPLALAALILQRLLGRLGLGPGPRALIAWGYGLGSLAFPYGTLLYGHQAAAACLLGAWAALDRQRRDPRAGWPLLVGLLLGLSMLIEYTTLLLAAPLALHALLAFPRRGRDTLLALAGAVLPLGLLVAYQAACFGAPWATGYGALASPHYAEVHARGVLGLGAPSLGRLLAALFGTTRGLFFYAPWLALGLAGLVLGALRPRAGETRAGWLALSAGSLLYLVFASSLEPEAWGWSLGPRHLVPLLPFWALAVGRLWLEAAGATRFTVRALVPYSIATCVLPTVVFGGFPPDFSNPLADFVAPLVAHGCAAPGVASALGLDPAWGLLPLGLALLGLGAWVIFSGGGSPGARLLAAALAAGLIVLAFTWTGPAEPREQRALEWVERDVLQCTDPIDDAFSAPRS
ncbi:MAG TPA: hypothetical protein PK668_06000 [Myxococcota bacterium]|nr:hypothetical protein [Myxococcota bacterium]HRY92606.1 hypothetical protein [Myxococcota bacterium]